MEKLFEILEKKFAQNISTDILNARQNSLLDKEQNKAPREALWTPKGSLQVKS